MGKREPDLIYMRQLKSSRIQSLAGNTATRIVEGDNGVGVSSFRPLQTDQETGGKDKRARNISYNLRANP